MKRRWPSARSDAHVAGVQPPVGVDRGGRGLGLFVVAAHQRVAAREDLAGHLRRAGRARSRDRRCGPRSRARGSPRPRRTAPRWSRARRSPRRRRSRSCRSPRRAGRRPCAPAGRSAVELCMPAAAMPVRMLADVARARAPAPRSAPCSACRSRGAPWRARARSGRGSPPGRSSRVSTWRAPLTIEMSMPSEKAKR